MMRTTVVPALVLVALLLAAAGAMADGGAGLDHMGEDDHMDAGGHMLLWGAWPFFVMGSVVYWFLALPIALLVYTDAEERRMNGLEWLVAIAIPWVGLLVVPVYLVARVGHPRVAVRDPWSPGDAHHDRMRADGSVR